MAPSTETVALALASATAFACLDVVHVAVGRISGIHLVNAVAQLAIIAIGLATARSRARVGASTANAA